MAQEKQASTTSVQEETQRGEPHWDDSSRFWDDGITYWDRKEIRKTKQASTTSIKEKQSG